LKLNEFFSDATEHSHLFFARIATKGIPDFRKKEERDAYRSDRACTNPAVAGDQLLPCSAYPEKELTEEAAQANRRKWLEAHPE